MSLASTLRPMGLSLKSSLQNSVASVGTAEVPFNYDPDYLQLKRMLTRYQNLILLVPSSGSHDGIQSYDLTPLQRQIRAELYSPLPYHRQKWLHSIESARNLLLRLETHVQNIKSPRAKKEALKDLTAKRQIIKRLRHRVEEIGREVESSGDKAWESRDAEDEKLLGERADAVLATMRPAFVSAERDDKTEQTLKQGKPVTNVSEERDGHDQNEPSHEDTLFDSSVRRRHGQPVEATDSPSATNKGTTSGFSNLAQTEQSLQTHAREHEDLTSALVSMAAQLKQQSRAFQFSLTQDESFLNRAVEGLDLNLTSMEAASKNMAFLRRMSEEQGLLGRLKLYGIILGLWVIAVLLVFAGPKLRF